MSVKLLLLRSGEEVICQAREIVNKDTQEPMGYHLHKPFRLDILSTEEAWYCCRRQERISVVMVSLGTTE